MSDATPSSRSRHASTLQPASRAPSRRLTILLYGQSLSGTGHFVRIYELARALAARHDVHLVDGGRPVPRPPASHHIAMLPVPRIRRVAREIVPVDPAQPLASVMAARQRVLGEALEHIRPDAVVVEHFPFSKWGLRAEIVALVEHARAVRPGVRVLASLRDIPPGTGDDPRTTSYRAYVLRALDEYFDGVLVHTDPDLVPLDEHVPWAGDIRTPIACTGYVSEKLGPRPVRGRGDVIVSTGGAALPSLVRQSIEAWQRLQAERAMGDRRLVVFLPPFGEPEQAGASHGDPSIRFEPFTTEFVPWMAGADLSISQAGYNTCTNILEARTAAIVVPNAAMSDQGPRARRLAARGLASAIPSAELSAERLASAMLETLERGRLTHDVDLQGASRTCTLIEEWCAERPERALLAGGAHQP